MSSTAPTAPVVSALLDVEKVPYTTTYAKLAKTVRDAGLMKRRYDFYALLTLGLGAMVAGIMVSFIMMGDSWFQLLNAVALGLVLAQFGFLGHEASHRAIFATGPRNDSAGRVVSTLVLGLSYSWWMNKHNRHHANPNVMNVDPDIATDTISFHEDAAVDKTGFMKWFTQRQGTLFFPLLTLEGINLHYKSVEWLVKPSNRVVKGRAFELSLLAVRWTVYLGLLFWALPIGMAFAFLGVQLAVFGLYLGASFAPNHKGMPIIPENSKVDFLSKQVLTSRNIKGPFATFLLGGLNYQVEHHLFPSMARPYLRRTRTIVKEHCEQLGIPYTETTLGNSYMIVMQYLNRVGLSARDPFHCPVAGEYGR